MSDFNNISLYIPHVFPNFDKDYITKAFKDIGNVSKIDFVAKQDRNGGNFNAVYIHFNWWHTNKKATAFYDRVVDESKEARLFHDEPWYWIVLPNKAKKHLPGERKPRIDLGESKSFSIADVPQPKQSNQKRTYLNAILNTSMSDFDNEMEKLEAEALAAEKMLEDLEAKIKEKNDKKEAKKIEKLIIEEGNQILEVSFDEVAAFEAEIEAEMDEIEDFLEAEDENLVRIDGRYVQQLEQENWAMSAEIAELRVALIKMDQMYQAEAAKVRAFTTSVDL